MNVLRAVLCGSVAVSIACLAVEPKRPVPLKDGSEFLTAEVRAMEKDEFSNPASLWVTRGESLWGQPRGEAAKSCADCHGDATKAMRGVASRYPRHDSGLGRVVNLGERIDACVTGRQKAPALAAESEALLSLGAYVATQSRGVPLAVSIEGPARVAWETGRRIYHTRIGQLHLACTQCHDANWGKTLLAEKISQGHPTGWPAYRLEWQSMGSLQRRLRACFFGVRAEMPAYGSPDLVALELYLAWRAEGLALSVPGVRR